MEECLVAASDGDRVALQSMRFATPRSAGATCMTLGQLSKIQNNDNGSAPPRSEEAADDQVRRTICLQRSLCSSYMLKLHCVCKSSCCKLHPQLCISGVWLDWQLAQYSSVAGLSELAWRIQLNFLTASLLHFWLAFDNHEAVSASGQPCRVSIGASSMQHSSCC